MKYDSYRDGGTKSFKVNWFCYLISSTEVCLSVDGEWTAGYKGRVLTEKEKEVIIPYITKYIENDIKLRTQYLNDIKQKEDEK